MFHFASNSRAIITGNITCMSRGTLRNIGRERIGLNKPINIRQLCATADASPPVSLARRVAELYVSINTIWFDM